MPYIEAKIVEEDQVKRNMMCEGVELGIVVRYFKKRKMRIFVV
jgi:hypothetical protein